MKNNVILDMIGKISPQAEALVKMGLDKGIVTVYYLNHHKDEDAVFLAVEEDACITLFAYSINDTNNDTIAPLVKDIMTYHIANRKSKALCFNVHGKNTGIIDLISNTDFSLDAEGYHLCYVGNALFEGDARGLVEKGYHSAAIKQFTDLFDSAYHQLACETGVETNTYSKNESRIDAWFTELSKQNRLTSFWLDDDLVGAYIIDDSYIRDFVVHPRHQNKGLGKQLLASCLKHMHQHMPLSDITLRVMRCNAGAKRFYERHHFKEIACFSEHTYTRD